MSKNVKEKAMVEFQEEKEKEAVEQMKVKLVQLDKAEKIVRNIKREIEDLEDELSS